MGKSMSNLVDKDKGGVITGSEQTPEAVLDMISPCLTTIERYCNGHTDHKTKSTLLDQVPVLGIILTVCKTQNTQIIQSREHKSKEEKAIFYDNKPGPLADEVEVNRLEDITKHAIRRYATSVIERTSTLQKKIETDTRQILISESVDVLRSITDGKDAIEKLIAKNADLIDRLAAEIDTKISADEGSMENISLPNRPMKVAEEYQMLTSNAWLEAKTALDEGTNMKDEHEKEGLLCDVLQESYQQGFLHFDAYMSGMDKRFRQPFQQDAKHVETTKAAEVKGSGIPTKLKSSICDYLKFTAEFADIGEFEEKIFKEIGSKHVEWDELLEDDAFKEYLHQCARVGWKMAIQRPPMQFTVDLTGETLVNDNKLAEIAFGSKPNKPGAVVQYYKYPTLMHAEKVLVKGSVYVA